MTVHTGAETIQGRKLFKGGNYMRKYGIIFLKAEGESIFKQLVSLVFNFSNSRIKKNIYFGKFEFNSQ